MDALEPVLAEKLDEFKKLIPNVDFALDSIKSKFHLLR